MSTPAVTRVRPPETGPELAMLVGMLDFLRATAVRKLAGLSDEQAGSRPVPPSTLTPAGVVKHLAGTERFWFSIDFAGLDVTWPWPEDDLHGTFRLTPEDTLSGIVAEYQEECERSRQAIAGAGLDDRARGADMNFTLRYALLHMVEETARHCGHLDLLRERLDGQTGQWFRSRRAARPTAVRSRSAHPLRAVDALPEDVRRARRAGRSGCWAARCARRPGCRW